MGRTAWIIGLLSAVQAAGTSAPLEIVVQFNNFANTPKREVSAAKSDAAWVFRQAGIQVHWVDCPPPAPGPQARPVCTNSGGANVFVFSITGEDRREEGNESAFGFALVVGQANHAAAVYPRIANEIQGDPHSRVSDLLAMVMVHELGHLLFRSTQHGEGIMKRSWNIRDLKAFTQRKLTFTTRQAEEMRSMLVERTKAGPCLTLR